jgi:hypothetical protein
VVLSELRFVTPLKVGLLIVAIAYFLFTLHQTFMFTWIGEWEYLAANNPQAATWIFITDIQAYVFLLFRFIAGILAVSAVSLYFAKKGLPQSTTYKLLRAILIFEGLYWLGLLTSGIWGSLPTSNGFNIVFLLNTGLPCLVGSIGIPVSLFLLAYKLSPTKPAKAAIKWALIAGIFYVLTIWLNNTGMWITTVLDKGTEWLLSSPESLVSFASTVFGLLALAIYTAYFAKKSSRTQDWSQLKLRAIGGIITALGVFFLWNYLTWIFFGGWNEWYAWILGHNLDLWMLSLPLVGLPLLFHNKATKQS